MKKRIPIYVEVSENVTGESYGRSLKSLELYLACPTLAKPKVDLFPCFGNGYVVHNETRKEQQKTLKRDLRMSASAEEVDNFLLNRSESREEGLDEFQDGRRHDQQHQDDNDAN